MLTNEQIELDLERRISHAEVILFNAKQALTTFRRSNEVYGPDSDVSSPILDIELPRTIDEKTSINLFKNMKHYNEMQKAAEAAVSMLDPKKNVGKVIPAKRKPGRPKGSVNSKKK